jgi:DNA polymerase-1
LAIDGDSFAHRAYHGLPKTILTGDGKPAGAIVGFANFLMRLHASEQPRAVLVAGTLWTHPHFGTGDSPPIKAAGNLTKR